MFVCVCVGEGVGVVRSAMTMRQDAEHAMACVTKGHGCKVIATTRRGRRKGGRTANVMCVCEAAAKSSSPRCTSSDHRVR